MKKIYLFLFLSLQGLFLMAQTVSINLDEQRMEDVLTTDVQKWAYKVIISGHMKTEDFTFLNGRGGIVYFR